MYLFFDTETTGIPRNWKAPASDIENWPRLVQLAYLVYDDRGNLLESYDHIIKPSGFKIPVESSAVHGITTARALIYGKDLGTVLEAFHGKVNEAQVLVAHNMSFDEKIVGAEFWRFLGLDPVERKDKICTMETTTQFCAIPGNYGYKWPKLSELYYKLFGYSFQEAHNAFVDVQATAKCFWKLKELGIL